jgi:hypothetical protein
MTRQPPTAAISAYEANAAAGKAPYEGVKIRTPGELSWVMQERRWSGELGLPEGYERANLSGANLNRANLSRARLFQAILSGAHLRFARLDATAALGATRLDTHTLLADVVWNGAPLTRLNWQDVTVLGDEYVARQPKDKEGKCKDKTTRLGDYAEAVLANRQVATVLRSQGVNEHADRFAFRA